MEILSERNVTILDIEYAIEERNKLYELLTGFFGRDGYSVTRCGPRGDGTKMGLMIVEVYLG